MNTKHSFCILHSAFCIALAATAASAATSGLYVQDGLIAHWDGLENAGVGVHDSGATVWKDLVGGREFALHNVTVDADRMTFAGAGTSYGNLSKTDTTATFTAARDGTMEIVYASRNGAASQILLQAPAASGLTFSSWVSGGSYYIIPFGGSSNKPIFAFSSGTATNSVSVRYTSGAPVSAVGNGTPLDSPSNNYWGTTGDETIIGTRAAKNGNHFPGSIYCIRLYDRKLTDAEIAANHVIDKIRFSYGADTCLLVTGSPSDVGAPSPDYGVTSGLAAAASIQCSAPAAWTNAACDTAAACTGWKIYDENGEVVSNGMGNAFTYTHPDPAAYRRLEWQFDVEYKVTATAGEGGAVSPAEQWVAHGATATISAIADEGYDACRWSGSLPKSAWYGNPTAFTVTQPHEVVADFISSGTIPPYAYRLIVNGGSYTAAASWEDDRVPPGDAEADDIFVAPNAGGNITYTKPFRSLTFEKGAKQFSFWSYGQNKVGAGGVTSPHADGPGVYGFTHVYLLCSQRWLFNGTGSFTSYGGYTLPEDAVWTLCGPNSLSITRPAPAQGTPVQWTALGRMRSNMTLSFSAYNLAYLPTNGLYWTNNDLDGGHVKTNALGVPNISLSITHADDPDIPVPPIEWDFTNPKGAWQYGTGNTGGTLLLSDSSYGGRMRFGAWSGRINDAVVKIDYRAGKNLFNPYRAPRMVLANPGTLDTSGRPRIWWKRGMLEIGDDNAFGVSNRFSLLIGHAGIGQDTYGDGWGGIAAGIVAAPGITVGSDMCVSNANVYYTLGRQVWLGAMDAGAPAVFTGDVENNDAMLSKSLMWARCPSQIRLFSGRGAEAWFTGSFSGSALLPMEIHGWGATRLSGDNSGLKAGVSVRSGTLKVADVDALGHHPVSLGGTVPEVIDVAYYSSTGLTFKAGSPFIVDGHEVQPGERVLNMTRVYKLAADGSSFTADPDVSATAYGIRANITNGVVFAGTAFQCVHAFNNACAFIEEPPEPSAALLADGPRTITNDVAVTDNHSSGASTIGGTTNVICTFSGKIVLNRGVTFHAAAGGVVKIDGAVTDANGEVNAFAFSGTGEVRFKEAVNLGGRVISFPGLTDETLDATGQRVCTLVTAPGGLTAADIVAPSLSKWQLRVKPTSIRAIKDVCTIILMQ